ncbi:MAG: hypothetical protein N2234_00130 [Planctomycetota bacterium]|nr:hypothetical protein [Planctomycetota bacterium]
MRVFIAILVLLCGAVFVFAQDKEREQAAGQVAGVDQARVKAAVQKGIEFLKSKQNADGSWPVTKRATGFPEGATALCLLALLKGGEPKTSEAVKKALDYLYKQQFRSTYSVSCLILALAALAESDDVLTEKEIEKEIKAKRTQVFIPPEEKQKRDFGKLPDVYKDWMKRALEWLLQQQKDVWSYGGQYQVGPNARVDASNSQYALLALHAASRCGLTVPDAVFFKIVQYFLVAQEQDGPKVKGFPVPIADFDVKELKQLERQILERMRGKFIEAVEKGEEKDVSELLRKVRTEGVTIDESPYRKFGGELKDMRARGWGYVLPQNQPEIPKDDIFCKAVGSMTCSGVAALAICKANLSGLSGDLKKAVNEAIRDGCAWLAHNFAVNKNPNCPDWHYYYLYGLERAGILSLVYEFGTHNWYKEGAEFLLGAQRADGSWPGEEGQQRQVGQLIINAAALDETVNTCFAILFLKRATAPIVKLPEDIYTGKGVLGPAKEPSEKPK